MANIVTKINTMQREVYAAHARMIEVETRDLGWTSDEARDAEREFEEAVNSYKSAFDMEPEFGAACGLPRFPNYPLFSPSIERIMEICATANAG